MHSRAPFARFSDAEGWAQIPPPSVGSCLVANSSSLTLFFDYSYLIEPVGRETGEWFFSSMRGRKRPRTGAASRRQGDSRRCSGPSSTSATTFRQWYSDRVSLVPRCFFFLFLSLLLAHTDVCFSPSFERFPRECRCLCVAGSASSTMSPRCRRMTLSRRRVQLSLKQRAVLIDLVIRRPWT
jgi:hypothetical protein